MIALYNPIHTSADQSNTDNGKRNLTGVAAQSHNLMLSDPRRCSNLMEIIELKGHIFDALQVKECVTYSLILFFRILFEVDTALSRVV